jgi:hypothetical protein
MQPADAAVYWSDFDSGYAQPAPMMPPRPQRARRHSGKKIETQAREAVKPQGPLIIAISINKQNLRIYDANGFFAETPVSTGMRGHSTPMGVFSIIQKQKYHRSNIYSGAPMPFMERITWSGIAMHAGVLPGYPASHGCIRMPMAFAVKMYGWTRMGARVVVTPGEMTPASFSHPLLVAQKVLPLPVTSDQPKASPLSTGDKADNAGAAGTPATSEASFELRSSVGHADRLQADMDVTSPTPLSEQTHTANAGAVPTGREAVTMSDAALSSDVTRSATQVADNASPGDIPATAASDDTSVEAKPAQPAAPEIITAVAVAADHVGDKTVEPQAPASGDVVKADAYAGIPAIDGTKAEAKALDVTAATPGASAAKTRARADQNAEAATEAPTAVPDVKKDQGRLSDVEKAAAANPVMAIASKRGPISVFISRKDAKLYVRQNFAPLFDVPVTIAPSDRALGTHIFTAEADKTDANILRWSVVSLPSTRSAERRDDDARVSQRRKMAGAPEIRPTPEPDSPAEALDRLTVPADAMARITEALSTGGSIIVSDQGIAAGETGEGTDFIVSLR